MVRKVPEGFDSDARPVRPRAPDRVARAAELVSWGLVAVGVVVALMRSAGLGVLASEGTPIPLAGVLTTFGAWLLCLVPMTLLARHPRILNYPAPVTEENAARVYRAGERMLTWLGAAVSITMLGVTLEATGLAAEDTSGGLVAVGLVTLVGATIGGVIATSSAAQARTSAPR